MNDDLPREILRARVGLMLDEPYLASAVARFPVVNAGAMDWCETMATDGYYIYVNPGFCAGLPAAEIAFVFAHEVMHCVLGHIDRRGPRQPERWNRAIDYATNLMLVEMGLKMPASGLLDRSFRGLSAEDIYGRLEDQDVDGGGSSLQEDNARGWDAHLSPDDIRGHATRAQEYPSTAERRRLRIGLTKAMSEKLRGQDPGVWASEIRKAGGGDVPWRALLSRFFTGLRRDDYRLFPPNRKHIWRGLYLPAMGAPGPSHIVAAVDTSGSMSEDELAKILGELDRLRSVTECKLTLIECDAQIHRVEEFEAHEAARLDRRRFQGRGGTAFEPVFDWITERLKRPMFQLDALIYLTDGYGSFPAKPPPYPTLWALTAGAYPDIPFGEIICMNAG